MNGLMEYRVLPIWQPSASLIFETDEKGIFYKQIETRSRPTKIRGTIMIYACKTTKGYRSIKISPDTYQLNTALNRIEEKASLVYGYILGIVDIVDCGQIIPYGRESVQIATPGFGQYIVSDREKQFGDYRLKRYGWILSNPRKFVEPIPFVAKQGWNILLHPKLT